MQHLAAPFAALDLLSTCNHLSTVSYCIQLALDRLHAIVHNIAVPVDLTNRDEIVRAACSSLNSKVVSTYANTVAPFAFDAFLSVRIRRVGTDTTIAPDNNGDSAKAKADTDAKDGSNKNGGSAALLKNIGDSMGLDTSDAPQGTSHNALTKARNDFVDPTNIRTVNVVDGSIDDTDAVDGLLFNQSTSRGGFCRRPRVTNAKVALIQFSLSTPKTAVDSSLIIQVYTAMDRVLREQRQ